MIVEATHDETKRIHALWSFRSWKKLGRPIKKGCKSYRQRVHGRKPICLWTKVTPLDHTVCKWGSHPKKEKDVSHHLHRFLFQGHEPFPRRPHGHHRRTKRLCCDKDPGRSRKFCGHPLLEDHQEIANPRVEYSPLRGPDCWVLGRKKWIPRGT